MATSGLGAREITRSGKKESKGMKRAGRLNIGDREANCLPVHAPTENTKVIAEAAFCTAVLWEGR